MAAQSKGYMRAEITEARAVFARTVLHDSTKEVPDMAGIHGIHTVARGSSDAAATILAYEMMRVLRLPVTSLPPSIFSLGHGVEMRDTLGLVISQSGASEDLLQAARGMKRNGSHVIAICNMPEAPVIPIADGYVPIAAGPELAIPATKSVVGSIAAGMSLLAALSPSYRPDCEVAARAFSQADEDMPDQTIVDAITESENIYVLGRGAGLGAAQEVALKIKECCTRYAEAFSASEVLHGPLQLVERNLTVLVLDTGEANTQPSLDKAEQRFREAGARVHRISADVPDLTPAAASAMLLCKLYRVILEASIGMGFDPDTPSTLSKITKTL